ncbi:MAG: hypothetical protein A3I70_09780 [Deltaproteobacteria bacterium RIFCSPLOWO2_02_FULL_44_34]|nr:MAG: hypothetical protein A3I70_09780 [Deltaproteobacteria bacterium RIFCSPLOWO2_02_FULL_44_34]
MILMRTFLTLIFMLGISQGLAQQLESIYTDLKGKACKLVWQHEITGDTESECPGVGGNKLIVEDHDVRMSVTVIDPQGEKHRLNYYHTISRGTFSELGSKAEWMVQKKGNQTVPVALIVRVNAHDVPGDEEKFNSYLAVAKITSKEICVTDKIPPKPNANELARQAGATAQNKPCLPSNLAKTKKVENPCQTNCQEEYQLCKKKEKKPQENGPCEKDRDICLEVCVGL